MRRVCVGMSGGVDSSVAALLLKKQGHSVVGVYMKNWDEVEETGYCRGEEDRQDAMDVCAALSIEFREVSFEREYWSDVFSVSVDDYTRGDTPNPDILCNREIKFKHFLDFAFDRVGADYLATGHYARLARGSDGKPRLMMAEDATKDQSYFLSQVQAPAFERVLFPLGGLLKTDVRRIAREHGLSTAQKRDSTGMCFVGKRPFAEFIGGYIPDREGVFRHVDTGAVVGVHEGVHRYTLGQNARISGAPEKMYVLKKDVRANELLIGPKTHSLLKCASLQIAEMSWVALRPPATRFSARARIRHQGQLVGVDVEALGDGGASVAVPDADIATGLLSVARGQTCALYSPDGECYGGGLCSLRGTRKWPT